MKNIYAKLFLVTLILFCSYQAPIHARGGNTGAAVAGGLIGGAIIGSALSNRPREVVYYNEPSTSYVVDDYYDDYQDDQYQRNLERENRQLKANLAAQRRRSRTSQRANRTPVLSKADTEEQVKEINEEYDKEFGDPELDRSND